MKKQNFITLTLIISGLALNPVMADAVYTTVELSQKINDPVSSAISSLLYNRGLDKDAADEISKKFVSEEDEVLFALVIEELDRENIASRKEIMEHLSTMALHRQKFDLFSHDHLVGMVTKIRLGSLDSKTLKELHRIAKRNRQLFV